ncbi:MAG: PorP/SprF family type IX secretion system membrane protein [Bacteroidales bacterium]|nr:PorP/SprF family type IX secretion system membrane protein [Bacteroidales bacterium]
MNKTKYVILSVFLLSAVFISGQDRALLNSQYLFNGLVLNPACAGRNEVFTFTFSHRSQWMGFEGAPSAQTISLHWPMKDVKTALGVLLFNESIGSRNYKNIFLNYAYRIDLGNGRLSLGLKGGISTGRFDLIDLGDGEFIFDDKLENYLLPNFGIGAYYYNGNFFAGFSIPLLLGYHDGGETIGLQVYHDFEKYSYYLTAGYSFPLNNNLRLQPSFLLHYEISYSFEPDFNLTLNYKDIILGGLSYRPNEAFIFLFNYRINYQARAGVSYDLGLGELSKYHNGSLEFTFQYEFGFKIRASDPGDF